MYELVYIGPLGWGGFFWSLIYDFPLETYYYLLLLLTNQLFIFIGKQSTSESCVIHSSLSPRTVSTTGSPGFPSVIGSWVRVPRGFVVGGIDDYVSLFEVVAVDSSRFSGLSGPNSRVVD